LVELFRAVGFRSARPYARLLGGYVAIPAWIPRLAEGFLAALPPAIRRALAKRPPLRQVLGIQLVGIR